MYGDQEDQGQIADPLFFLALLGHTLSYNIVPKGLAFRTLGPARVGLGIPRLGR